MQDASDEDQEHADGKREGPKLANRLALGRVHIVEWLNPGDDDTGRKLFDELQPMGAAFDPTVEVDCERTRAFLLNHEARFDLEWRKFFYIDEFPENAKRFDFTIDDCRPAA